MVLIGGDFNASLGVRTDATPQELRKLLGPWGLHCDGNRCDSWQALREFMAVHDMRATGTFFEKRRYATWYHPGSDRVGYNPDHWLCQRAHCKWVQDVSVRPCMSLDSDHTAVMLTVAVRGLSVPCNRD